MKDLKGQVISITSSKGGVGKTILATNLCGVYETLKKRVLLIDLDLTSGGVSVLLNLEKAKTIYNLADDILNNRFKNDEDYVYHYSEYIDIIPACKDPRQGSKMDSRIIEQIISLYRHNYDVILLDTTHNTCLATLTSLDVSTSILYVVTDNPMDLKNSANMLSILKSLEKNVKVVLNLSIKQEKTYFSKFDIKSIIGQNIDYILPQSMFIENINKYMMEGKILVLNKHLSFKNNSDRELMIKLAEGIIGDNHEK